MAATAHLSVRTVKDVTIAAFTDESLLDASLVQYLAPNLFALLDSGPGERRIVLDFTRVRGISSAVLGMLLTLKKKVDTLDGRVILAGLDRDVRRLFEMTALDRLFTFASDVESALVQFGVQHA